MKYANILTSETFCWPFGQIVLQRWKTQSSFGNFFWKIWADISWFLLVKCPASLLWCTTELLLFSLKTLNSPLQNEFSKKKFSRFRCYKKIIFTMPTSVFIFRFLSFSEKFGFVFWYLQCTTHRQKSWSHGYSTEHYEVKMNFEWKSI